MEGLDRLGSPGNRNSGRIFIYLEKHVQRRHHHNRKTFWEEVNWGKKFANVPILQENVKITLIRAKLVTEGVPRVPTL